MVPILQLEKAPLEFTDVTVRDSLISDTTQLIDPKLGSSKLLLTGNNNEVNAYSLLRFDNFNTLPDTVDSIVCVTLKLLSSTEIPYDTVSSTNVGISISLLKSDIESNWSEDSSSGRDFSLEGFNLTKLRDTTFSSNDTIEFVLPDSIISFWRDSLVTNYGIIIQLIKPAENTMVSFYSRQNSSKSPILEVEYLMEGDTVTTKKSFYPTADLSILNFYQTDLDSKYLLMSNGQSLRSFLKFDLSNIITDKNWVIAEALLHLKVDTLQMKGYGDNIHFYVNLLDSVVDWSSSEYIPDPNNIETGAYVSEGDTSLTLRINKTIQQYTSGYRKNFGIVLWVSPSTLDISVLSLFSSSHQNPNKRPYLEILAMKEK
ncbi:MAG: DNRLRE domain-containing protein [Candidatus Marinimicrobia bacterium]|nr:DNRLRE domain-containing protein [Candidatus Neomarinimicrobiota bacterium]